MENNENKNSCEKCGGRCCKTYPGLVHPNQLVPSLREGLIDKLSTGKYIIDYWDGDIDDNNEFDQIYFLRPNNPYNSTFGCYSCVFLSDNGCSLSFQERPYNCQGLVPKNNDKEKCKPLKGSSKEELVREWRELPPLKSGSFLSVSLH